MTIDLTILTSEQTERMQAILFEINQCKVRIEQLQAEYNQIVAGQSVDSDALLTKQGKIRQRMRMLPIVISILEDNENKPMTSAEIVQELHQRNAMFNEKKKNSLYNMLSKRKDVFVKCDDRKYRLVKRRKNT